MATLVDTNVLIDMTLPDSKWHEWARLSVQTASRTGRIVINQIILAEFAIRYESMEEIDRLLPPGDFGRESLPWHASLAASKAFRQYRTAGGSRDRALPDFFIGAHAAIRGHRILTRDVGYRTYFPMVEIIAPDTHP